MTGLASHEEILDFVRRTDEAHAEYVKRVFREADIVIEMEIAIARAEALR